MLAGIQTCMMAATATLGSAVPDSGWYFRAIAGCGNAEYARP